MQIPMRGEATPSEVGLRSTRKVQDNLTILLFLLPAFAFFFIFLVYPIARSAYFSLFDWNGMGPAVNYVGLDNYQRILTDLIFRKAVLNGLLIVGLSLALQLPFALGLAIMIGRDLPGRAFFRTVFFLPYVLSEAITGIIFLLIEKNSRFVKFHAAQSLVVFGVLSILGFILGRF